MGVYSTDRGVLGAIGSDSIVANESYVGEIGAIQIMIENSQNDQAIFEAVIGNDFEEAAKAQSGTVLESEMLALQEASLGGMVDTIKAFLTKCWEKIKGVFKSIITKLNNVIIRDNKAFVDKYKAEVLKKDLSKMKYKYSKPTGAYAEPKGVEEIEKATTALVSSIEKASSLTEFEEKLNSGDFLEAMLGSAVGSATCTPGDFAKEYHEKLYEDSSEEENLTSSMLSDIISSLTTSKTTVSELEKVQTAYNKMFTARFKQIDALSKAAVKKIPGEAGKSQADKDADASAVKRINTVHKAVSVEQVAANKILAANITEVKFGIKQDRRLFAQAAAFNAKAVKENALLVEAAGEAAEYELESSFNDYSM